MFRISHNGQEPIVDVDSIEQIEPAIQSSPQGRYHVDEISAQSSALGSYVGASGFRDQKKVTVLWRSRLTHGTKVHEICRIQAP